ncbi:hybrid sensor histidine kinase/response regulator [Brevundimonas naejangsanensis]|uniref:Chemotaxis protein CheA n=1 Tax=Brevundimonas naejangsanensis TaxID=588932 RepID=A0A494RFL0_9CAUL|nr:chemotaxis protein CheW [Brevundimonas naejangsanensis]AYG95135.1 hybrid sensor histidine kinase/response regulator [Brevundimonas naejangsanensis]
MDEVLSDFIAETREGLEALDSELVRFERNPRDPEPLAGVFRLMHTIKGACGFIGLVRLQRIAHAAEEVLGGFRDGSVSVSAAAVTTILESVDVIRGLIDALDATGEEPAGEDAALITRLEAACAAAAAPRPAPHLPESAPIERPLVERPLIERLGGDAVLDAAAEAAAPALLTEPWLGGADPVLLQAALLQGLLGAARGGDASALARALEDIAHVRLPDEMRAPLFEAVAAALDALGAAPDDVAELRACAGAAAPPPPPAPPPTEAAPSTPAGAGKSAATIRINVEVLEQLMRSVSELVLIRNQMIQTLRQEPESPFKAPLHRLNQVTSEIQEKVMVSRMQPIGGAWAKLPRLVRDLENELGKRIELRMSGQETELDRQVMELIRDPLTHMIRNAADHGLETPEQRRAVGKREVGRITLSARHEGGAIVIEVADDGRGLSVARLRAKAASLGLLSPAEAEQISDAEAMQLIFRAGFSTASQVTSVSGRGVGMDVVRANIEQIGGVIELTSKEGQGACFTVRIPLTLAIVSALIVEAGGVRFALPQSSIMELVNAGDASGRSIEQIDGAPVLRLRERLLPLVSLRRLLKLDDDGPPAATSETCIVVTHFGACAFGVIVDRVFDIEEIVVKPVAGVLRHLNLYSGATILGDGAVILILDPKGAARAAGVEQVAGRLAEPDADASRTAEAPPPKEEAMLLFRASDPTLRAAPLAAVSRIEEIESAQVERVEGRAVMRYRGRLMPILGADGRAPDWSGPGRRPLLVLARGEQSLGLLIEEIVDIVDACAPPEIGRAGGLTLGSLIVLDQAADLIDVDAYRRRAFDVAATAEAGAVAAVKRLLIIDASPFSQMLLRPLLAQTGYVVTVVPDAEGALARHDAGEDFDLILADLQPGRARAFARILAGADRWRATPLLSLGRLDGPDGGPALDAALLLDAVSDALTPESAAA